MKNIFALGGLLAASAVANPNSPTEVLSVSIHPSENSIEKGDDVTFTCSWNLEETAVEDYDIDDFALFWKVKYEGDTAYRAILRYEPNEDDPDDDPYTIYRETEYSARLFDLDENNEDRFEPDGDFQENQATLTLKRMDIEEDGIDVQCEVHWGKSYSAGSAEVDVYVDATNVELTEIDAELDARPEEDEPVVVAHCAIDGVYPEPDDVTFLVNDEEVTVDATAVENEDGTFDIDADLTLIPDGKYDGAEIQCISKAAINAETITSISNQTITLDVLYYTNSVVLTLDGAEGDSEYNINEEEEFTINCRANGNPPPQITI